MLSLNLQSMRLNAGDSKITNDEEVSTTNSVHHLISGYFVNLKVPSVCFRFPASVSGPLSRRKNCCFWIIFPITEQRQNIGIFQFKSSGAETGDRLCILVRKVFCPQRIISNRLFQGDTFQRTRFRKVQKLTERGILVLLGSYEKESLFCLLWS